jgi:two-component system, NarL family, nitrate/nitrite response regulator NarL
MATRTPLLTAQQSAKINEQSKSDRLTVKTTLISDSALIRSGLRRVLQEAGFDIVEERSVTTSESFPPSEIGLFIVDASPPSYRVLEIVMGLRRQNPNTRIVVLGDRFDLRFMRMGREAGVDLFILAGSAPKVLINLLELTLLGEKVLPRALFESVLLEMMQLPASQMLPASAQDKHDPGHQKFSPRETTILQGLIGGETNKMIARDLDIAEGTIKVHIKSILRKIGATNRTQAAVWAKESLRFKERPNLK